MCVFVSGEYDALVTFSVSQNSTSTFRRKQTSSFTNPLPERQSGRATKTLFKATIHHLDARLCSWIVTLIHSNLMQISFIQYHHSLLQSDSVVIDIMDRQLYFTSFPLQLQGVIHYQGSAFWSSCFFVLCVRVCAQVLYGIHSLRWRKGKMQEMKAIINCSQNFAPA